MQWMQKRIAIYGYNLYKSNIHAGMASWLVARGNKSVPGMRQETAGVSAARNAGIAQPSYGDGGMAAAVRIANAVSDACMPQISGLSGYRYCN